jgi:hypothetical protein
MAHGVVHTRVCGGGWQRDKEVTEFLLAVMRIMGEHFTEVWRR